MNQAQAKYLSEKLSNQEIYDMLQEAKQNVPNWDKSSKANAMFSRGKFWNMFKCGEFDISKPYATILKFRFIQEFGEYLPEKYQPIPKKRHVPDQVFHEDPKFNP